MRCVRASCLALLLSTATLRADTLWVTGADGRQTFPVNDVLVLRIDNEALIFTTQLGNQSSRPLAEISRLKVNNEPLLTQAEDALANGQPAEAIDAFERAMQTSNVEWLKIWSALRILKLVPQTNRFDAGSAAWIELVQLSSDQAKRHRPPLPEPGSSYLNTMQAQLEKGIKASRNQQQQALLLQLLMDVNRARNDNEATMRAAERLAALDPRITGEMVDASMLGDMKLTAARAAITRGDFTGAIREIEAGKSAMVRPEQQSRALWLLAEARRLSAGDRNASLDAAIAYLRLTANFPTSENAGQALVRAGQIMQQLGDAETARLLFEQAAAEYPQTKVPKLSS